MRLKNFLPWVCSCALALLASCSFAGTNNPGVIYIPGSVPYDHDATNFIGRAGINPRGAEAKAIGRLVADLKRWNLWTNFDAIYPFVGATSNSCAQNLVSTNWGVTWNGAPQFLRTGVKSGTGGWGDTQYKQNTRGVLTNNFHLYAWAALEAVGVNHSGLIIGNFNELDEAIGNECAGGLASTYLGSPTATNYISAFVLSYTNGVNDLNLITRGSGNALSTRSGTNCILIGEPYGSDPGLITTNLIVYQVPTNSVKLLGDTGILIPARAAGYFLGTLRGASFGRSLTYNQATNYFAIMDRFQTDLHRQ